MGSYTKVSCPKNIPHHISLMDPYTKVSCPNNIPHHISLMGPYKRPHGPSQKGLKSKEHTSIGLNGSLKNDSNPKKIPDQTWWALTKKIPQSHLMGLYKEDSNSKFILHSNSMGPYKKVSSLIYTSIYTWALVMSKS